MNPDISNVLPGELEDGDPMSLGHDADYLLANDPEFASVCDARRDSMFERMEEDACDQ